jgi:hypothetical protein
MHWWGYDYHSTFSINRLERFRESDILRHIFERIVAPCMANGLVKGEGFALDASVMEANASRYHGKAPDELGWTDAQRQSGRWQNIWQHLKPRLNHKPRWIAATAMAQIMGATFGLTASRPR